MFFRPFNHYECDACLRVRRSEQNDVSSEASCMIYGTFAPSSLIGDLFEPDHQLLEFYHAIRACERVAPSRATTRVPTPPQGSHPCGCPGEAWGRSLSRLPGPRPCFSHYHSRASTS